MAQHDYVVANQSGSSFRADLNNALSAIVSQNSGASEPSTTYAYQTWADTTAGVMKMRNGANSAWITLYQLDGEWSTIAFENGTAAAPSIYFKDSGTDTGFYSPGANQVGISTGGTSAVVVDASQRLLVGTSTARANFNNASATALAQIEGTTAANSSLSLVNNSTGDTSYLYFGRSKGTTVGSNSLVSANDFLGVASFQGSDGTEFVEAAAIYAQVDGTPGANDMPGRIVLSTTSDGASSPTERMRINSSGYAKFANDGSPTNSGLAFHGFDNSGSDSTLYINQKNTSFTSSVFTVYAQRSASSAYNLAAFHSTHVPGSTADVEQSFRGDGEAYADGSWNGGGADYAEYFEWSDGNADAEDRRGISVVLDGDKIREAIAGEDPIGVISGNPSVVGDAAWNKWTGKHLRDDFGTYILEDYEVEDEDGNTVIQQRRTLNPAYDPDQEYIPREQRPEWDCVGLMGKLRIRKGQVTGSRWIKMRDISDSVEEWLVR